MTAVIVGVMIATSRSFDVDIFIVYEDIVVMQVYDLR